jgi:glycerol uptake facilitator-like aquaporin
MQTPDRARRFVAETVGSALLLAAIVGSGVMAERLAGGNVAIALLANTLATGAALVALILTFGPVSGAHFNPAVTIADASQGGIRWSLVPGYVGAQLAGACIGVLGHTSCSANRCSWCRCAHAMARRRCLASVVATFGLLAVIWGVRGDVQRPSRLLSPPITSGYWFTAST